MPYNLLIDFGATRTKSAIADTDVLLDIKQGKSLPFSNQKTMEISVRQLHENFQNILLDYLKCYDIKNVITSCQMHGFALQDEKGNFITDYISWQDERAFIPYQGVSSYDVFKNNFPNYKNLSGMRLRGCFPVVKILDFLRKNKFEKVKVLSLAEILDSLGKPNNKVQYTMAQASGCFDFDKKEFSKEIVSFIHQETGCKIYFNEPCDDIEISSQLNINGKKINLLSGVGDHQASLLGALGKDLKGISINIGTGSQITQIRETKSEILENRFFFNGKILNTITHIPAGRVIAKYIDFLNEESKIDYWDVLEQLSLQEVLDADLQFNLALFLDAFGFDDKTYGMISHINMLNLTKRKFVASMMKNFIYQYLKILKYFDKDSKIIISGGKLAKNNLLKQILVQRIPNCDISCSTIQEEALQGINYLSRRIYE